MVPSMHALWTGSRLSSRGRLDGAVSLLPADVVEELERLHLKRQRQGLQLTASDDEQVAALWPTEPPGSRRIQGLRQGNPSSLFLCSAFGRAERSDGSYEPAPFPSPSVIA